MLAEFVGINNFIGIRSQDSLYQFSFLHILRDLWTLRKIGYSICSEARFIEQNKSMGHGRHSRTFHIFFNIHKSFVKIPLNSFGQHESRLPSETSWQSQMIVKPFIFRPRARRDGSQCVVIESEIMIGFGSCGESRAWKAIRIWSAAEWRWIIRHWFNLFSSLRLPCTAAAKARWNIHPENWFD